MRLTEADFRIFTRVAAQTLRLLHTHKVRDDRYLTSCLEAIYASFVLGEFCELRNNGVLRSRAYRRPSIGASNILSSASTVSGIETTLESAPLAPASIARPATVVSRLAVNTRVGMGLPTPPSLISATSSSPFPSGNVMSMSAPSSPPSRNRARASAAEPASTKVTTSTGPYRYYNPITARITVTALAWVNPEEVGGAFGDAQRQLLRGDPPPPTRDEGMLEVVKFVARRMRERPAETWEDRWKAWKRTNPSCPYNSYSAFRQVYDRFRRRYVYRRYEPPNYIKRERTPYELYRDDWNERFTRRKGRHAG